MTLNRLLIIEDDYNTLIGLQELLSYEGYNVSGVSNGHKALDVIATDSIDMVLCDYCLPDMDGVQVCRALKELKPNLIIFMITAFRNTELDNLLQEGIIEMVFNKPIILDELYEILTVSSERIRINHQSPFA